MPKKRFTADQIIGKLREAEVLQAQGMSIQEASRHLDVTEQTYYRWRKSYGGMRTDQAKRLKELKKENARLAPPTTAALTATPWMFLATPWARSVDHTCWTSDTRNRSLGWGPGPLRG